MIGLLLGSIPTGLLVGRARGVDIRAHGSKNIGATNAFRVLGARWGALVFAIDVVKGLAAVLLARGLADAWTTVLAMENLYRPHGVPSSVLLIVSLVAGVGAILGHVFTPWLGFRGGRGVATSLGVFLGIVPWPTLLAFFLWGILFAISKRVSVGSIGACVAYPFLVWFLGNAESRGVVTVVTAAVAALVLVRHIPNIRRILSGTEPRTIGARTPKAERT